MVRMFCLVLFKTTDLWEVVGRSRTSGGRSAPSATFQRVTRTVFDEDAPGFGAPIGCRCSRCLLATS